MTKVFSIGEILSAYTGVLMCDIDGIYKILDFLAHDKLFTHQLPRASRDAKPWLLESLPWLEGVTLEEVTPENAEERLEFYTGKFGTTHELSPIPHAEELHRDPIDEAEEMMPGRVIAIKLPGEEKSW